MLGLLVHRSRMPQEASVSAGFSSAFRDHDAKDRVRQAVDIVDLVGDYLQLRREGRIYKALCPWHDDSRPSLQVNPERQSYRCWVCDLGGDIFSFVMKMENVAFPEAMQLLADRAGIKLDTRGSGSNDAKRLLYQALAWAEQQFHDYLLRAPDAEQARNYLHNRGITDESIRKFRLGYSPEAWDWLINRAHETPYTPKVLETVGMVVPRERGSGGYDRFRGRVLFPIRDPQQRPVAFGGRVLPGSPEAEKTAKYINSPETPLFSKSRLLYGLDVAKDAMAKTRTVVVMEGYTDAVIAQQCGFGNAVAVLGTALGEQHVHLLKRFVDRIVLVLDGDEAGRRRTDQILELFIAEQVDLRIVTPPDDLDPADFLLQRGSEAFSALLDGAVDALEHKIQTATRGLTATSGLHVVTQAVEAVLATLALAPRLQKLPDTASQLREDQVLHRLARFAGIQEDRLRQRLAELRRQKAAKGAQTSSKLAAMVARPSAEPRHPQRVILAESWLLQIVLEWPDFLPEIRAVVREEQFRCPKRRAIYGLAGRLADAGQQPTFERMMLELDDTEMKSTLVQLDDERQAIGRLDAAKELRDLLTVFHDDAQACRTADLADVHASIEAVDEAKALEALVNKLRTRKGISVPTDG
ncbi:MAG TPA: DNA primase [Pirellulales bacterium]|nr:DNA primase [Pirellulales bacterium]